MAEIHALDSVVVVLKQQMTVTGADPVPDALHQLSVELTVRLAEPPTAMNARRMPLTIRDRAFIVPSDVLRS